jgi:hypothetical protein
MPCPGEKPISTWRSATLLRPKCASSGQKQIIAEIERDNHPQAAETSRQLLATFCETVELMRAHLAELRDSSSFDEPLRNP